MPEEHSSATSAPRTGAAPGDEWTFVILREGHLNPGSPIGSVASGTRVTVKTHGAETVSLEDESASDGELDRLSLQSDNGGYEPSILFSGKINPEAHAETPTGPQLAMPDASVFGPPLPGLVPGQDPCPQDPCPRREDTDPEERNEALQPGDADKSKRVAPHTCSSSPGLAECSTEELWTELGGRLWASFASLREKFGTMTTAVCHTLRPYWEKFASFWMGDDDLGRTSERLSDQAATDPTELTEKKLHVVDGETEPKEDKGDKEDTESPPDDRSETGSEASNPQKTPSPSVLDTSH